MYVSVIICTWNRAHLLRQTLECFCSLEVVEGVRWELIVVDNASQDDTKHVCEAFKDQLPLHYIFENRPGKSNAANAAVRAARGDLLMWTDDDALVSPNWVKATVDVFARTGADVVYGRVEPWWETEEPRWFTPHIAGRFALLDHGDEERAMDSETGHGYGVNYSFRRQAFELIGPFSSELGPNQGKGFGGEDTLLFLKAHEHGLRVVYSPSMRVRHFVPAERCRKSYFRKRRWIGSRDQLKMLKRDQNVAPRWLGIPRFQYRQAAENAVSLLKRALTGRYQESFHLELRVIGFVGLLYYACVTRKETDRLDPSSIQAHETNAADEKAATSIHSNYDGTDGN